jgi:hypothetical protein
MCLPILGGLFFCFKKFLNVIHVFKVFEAIFVGYLIKNSCCKVKILKIHFSRFKTKSPESPANKGKILYRKRYGIFCDMLILMEMRGIEPLTS